MRHLTRTAWIHPDIQQYSSIAHYMVAHDWIAHNYTDIKGTTTLYPKK